MKKQLQITRNNDGSQVVTRPAKHIVFGDGNKMIFTICGASLGLFSLASFLTVGVSVVVYPFDVLPILWTGLGTGVSAGIFTKLTHQRYDPGYDGTDYVTIPKSKLKNITSDKTLLSTQKGTMGLSDGDNGGQELGEFTPSELGAGNVIMETYLIKDGRKATLEYVIKPVQEVVWEATFDDIMELEAVPVS